MKVLQVASSLFEWGGIERYVHYLDQGLTDRGHRVVVACPPGSPLAARTTLPECLVANRLKYSLRTYGKFRRIGSAIKPDIVHVHFSPDFVMPVMALKQTTSAKIIMTRHLALSWPPGKVRRYTSLFDHFVPVSNAVEEKLAQSGVPRSMMTVAKAGVPVPQSVPTGTPPDGALRIGFFGRLVREKGIDVLLKAIGRANGTVVEVYGDGPELSSLKNLADSLRLQNRAFFRGHVTDVGQAMADVDVIAVPSVWDEAFPYSVLEAMAAGKPVVASNAGGIPELVQQDQTGMLFERGNHEALASILSEISNDRSRLATMGQRAREIQRSEYTVPKMAERIEDVYRIALEKS